ncbi:MAG: hypothetical protein LBD93_05365 [Treponema sp.]|nr:hypothetical protein [Treponema sp.]
MSNGLCVWRWYWCWLFAVGLVPVGYGEALPPSLLLQRAAQLSGELEWLNTELLRELNASREVSTTLQRELAVAKDTLSALRKALSEQEGITTTD